MDGSEWKAALRLQIEALARRNELHRRCHRDSVLTRTVDMDMKIIKLRELVSTDANYAAQFYLECVCHADETERILNRTSSRDNKRKKPKGLNDAVSTPSVATLRSAPSALALVEMILPQRSVSSQQPRWWEQFTVHRKGEEYADGQDEVRHLWKTQTDFFLSCLGFIVGIGNMLRFPGKICEYGGIFFAPYFFCLIVIGFPMLYLHLCIGQYAGQTADVAFRRLMPITCGLTPNDAAVDFSALGNVTLTSSELFFHLDILSLTNYTDLSITLPESHIVLALATAWLLVFLGVCRGTTWMSWAIRFTATIPYLMLFILLIRGLSLPGASVGLTYLFSSASDSISSLKMWSAAAEQVLFEIGVGVGALFSLAAYSRFRNNVYRDAALLITINALTSTLASMVLFSFLGLLAISSGQEISTLISHDHSYIIFTVIPSMTSLMRWGPLWMSILYGTIVFTAIDAEFLWVEMLASAAMNLLHSKNRRLNSRVIAVLCCLGFLLEIPICSSGGFFLFHAMDSLISSLSTFILSFLLLITVSYLYGLNEFLSDVSSMLRVPRRSKAKWAHLRLQEKLTELFGPCGTFMRLSWALVCPCFLTILMITHAVSYRRPLFFGCHVPMESEFFAWILVHAPLTAAFIGAIMAIVNMRKSGKTVSTLFDSSAWHQEITVVLYDDSPPPSPSSKTQPKRENTYMYIDPASRGPTVRSVFQTGNNENYAWKSGRLRDWQETVSLDQTPSQPSFAASVTSQGTLTLFGSPPASNGFMISDSKTVRPSSNSNDAKINGKRHTPLPTVILPSTSPIPHEIHLETLPRKFTRSEPPIKISSGLDPPPSTPAPRLSPSRSEPPSLTTDRPATSIRSRSESHDEFSDSDKEDGVRRQRSTVIRRFRSEDSVQAFSTESISNTPVDIARQRSLSSVAIFDDNGKGTSRPTQTLSQLKRPPPIETPTRF
ncbi:hypothetical protein RB195_011903 [Necator americanus]|uniref:Sodium:neurotransmitter symporter family protein n=1 Tax=Necator americanus TaxID=51031 RepID=A0ABR1D4J8_NECAM